MNKLLAIICSVFIFCSCASIQTENVNSKKLYSVDHYTSASYGSTYLNLQSFSFEDKDQLIPAAYHINNIPFYDIDNPGNNVLSVLPGQFKIRALAIGKEPTELVIELEKRDSVVVTIYLKDDTEPLHKYEKIGTNDNAH
ncbi:hypothetical protein [Rhodohalobacter barkolensis]|uniref:DUF2846 domain-containing protein n=1 Tax=Rhodohalobacter barkolensis TaxID=2053187 RepID=A0A2N0VJW9_9BACT|nr:hypothetical protein [Rhodohalobacter barkolensis]PKD44482.1 hypothetical protein CWD77_03170 [Rhodohalobacter barkolensis]